MNPVAGVRTRLADPVWRYALLCGTPAAVVVALNTWPSGSDMNFTPVLLAAAVAGFLFPGEREQVEGLGIRVTLVGLLPGVVQVGPLAVHAVQLPNPLWFTLLSIVLFATGALSFVLISAILDMAAASVGHWLAGKSGRYRAVAVDG